jgi:8-oxo-dGTP diphosphatase
VTAADQAVVHAAGAVCWDLAPTGAPARRDPSDPPGQPGLRVLLVHRPRYDDWSWPKGKLDEGEGVVEAAVREVAEETGLEVRLGRDLPAARYALDERTSKHVAYWAARVPGAPTPRPPRPHEVDALEWVSTEEADRRLTRRGDRVQLRALLEAHAEDALDTWPLLVVRHGHARPKSVWGHADADRPLVAVGRRQAQALVPLLAAWSPARVVSSPWERCLQTVEPYLEASGAKLRTRGRLSEDGHRRDPAKVARLVTKLLARGRPAAVCTHRPVLSTVLGTLAGHTSPGVGDAIPSADPYLEPGEVLVAHVATASQRVVRVERHLPGRR